MKRNFIALIFTIILSCAYSIKVNSFNYGFFSSENYMQNYSNSSESRSRLQDGVKLDSGLEYRVLRAGNGRSPLENNEVEVDYQGNLLDGTEFDSSYKRGESTSFRVNQVIQGWQEALKLMKEGDKWELYIPSNLAYGERGAGSSIPPNSDLKFVVELHRIK